MAERQRLLYTVTYVAGPRRVDDAIARAVAARVRETCFGRDADESGSVQVIASKTTPGRVWLSVSPRVSVAPRGWYFHLMTEGGRVSEYSVQLCWEDDGG